MTINLSAPVKILYIGGWTRSGSTLLTSVLGSIPGVFAGGELAYTWPLFHHPDWHCGCGSPLNACACWQEILTAAFGDRRKAVLDELPKAMQTLLNKKKHGPKLLWPPFRIGPDERFALDRLSEFYQGIRRATGNRIVVDSSKVPLYAAWLREVPGVEVYCLHLIRDPRAVAFSWSREKANMSGAGEGALPRRSSLDSALRWTGVNWAFSRMAPQWGSRYLRMRYSDFLKEPDAWMERIFSFIGEPELPNPVHHGKVKLRDLHVALGNPGRMQKGEITLRPRMEWKDEMPARDRRLVTTICAPLMLRYGYKLRGSAL